MNKTIRYSKEREIIKLRQAVNRLQSAVFGVKYDPSTHLTLPTVLNWCNYTFDSIQEHPYHHAFGPTIRVLTLSDQDGVRVEVGFDCNTLEVIYMCWESDRYHPTTNRWIHPDHTATVLSAARADSMSALQNDGNVLHTELLSAITSVQQVIKGMVKNA